MTSQDFCYWLQGYFEITGAGQLTDRELIIADHLQEVFKKVTPDRATSTITTDSLEDQLKRIQEWSKENRDPVPYIPPYNIPTPSMPNTWPPYTPSSPIWMQGQQTNPTYLNTQAAQAIC